MTAAHVIWSPPVGEGWVRGYREDVDMDEQVLILVLGNTEERWHRPWPVQ